MLPHVDVDAPVASTRVNDPFVPLMAVVVGDVSARQGLLLGVRAQVVPGRSIDQLVAVADHDGRRRVSGNGVLLEPAALRPRRGVPTTDSNPTEPIPVLDLYRSKLRTG
ncbi:MAG: hypothetical protein WC844_05340 [Patescibacteria group bacterium]|jgi:hypothetical protein